MDPGNLYIYTIVVTIILHWNVEYEYTITYAHGLHVRTLKVILQFSHQRSLVVYTHTHTHVNIHKAIGRPQTTKLTIPSCSEGEAVWSFSVSVVVDSTTTSSCATRSGDNVPALLIDDAGEGGLHCAGLISASLAMQPRLNKHSTAVVVRLSRLLAFYKTKTHTNKNP